MERRKALHQQYQWLLHNLARLREEADLFAQAAAILRHVLTPQPPNGNGQAQLTLGPVLGNLPAPLRPLVGRGRELVELHNLLRDTRLLVLVGPCGCGKTRLARELAETCVERFPDGTWWVDIHDVHDPTQLSRAVASALRLRPRAGDRTSDIATRLRHAHAILVLDNCEHQVAACATLVEIVLHACPHLRFLVTSRERLGLAGETRWPVRPLPAPPREAHLSLDEARTFDAVQLFELCARAIVPSFALTAENTGAVVEICARLDGLPLAIEMAASRLINLSPQEIAQRLEDRFTLLAGPRQGEPRYHHDLRSTVDRSYKLLSHPEQTLFRRISVFPGSFSLSEAETVCAGGDLRPVEVLDLLSGLVDKSMVDVEASGEGILRYRILDTLRAYGLARLAGAAGTLSPSMGRPPKSPAH